MEDIAGVLASQEEALGGGVSGEKKLVQTVSRLVLVSYWLQLHIGG